MTAHGRTSLDLTSRVIPCYPFLGHLKGSIVAGECPKCHSANPAGITFCGACGTRLSLPQTPPNSVTRILETSAAKLTRGSLFAGRYEIIEELGHGGMGRVYKTYDVKLNEEVAIKLIRPEIAIEKNIVERFRNEIKIARKIRHQNVCAMYDLHEEGEILYLTMEYVPGEDLKSLIHRAKALTIGKAMSVAKQVAEGLMEAHGLGVVHRDLKPGNIMIDKDGNARIMDFGIARMRQENGVMAERSAIGTPEYMSPEQREGKEADQRSDIYSLGIIFYEMLTGQNPFRGDTPAASASKQKSVIPRNPRELNPQIPEELGRLILKCLEHENTKRYQTVAEIHSEILRMTEGASIEERTLVQKKHAILKQITASLRLHKPIFPVLGLITLLTAAAIVWQILRIEEVMPAASATRSIAILPFEDLSVVKSHEPLAEGIPETLINALSMIEGLHVSARTSSFSFKGGRQDIHEIGQKLGVETLLEGSIQVAGNRLRVMVRLIKIADGFPIWTQDYNKPLDDVFSIQDDVARSVVKALRIKWLGEQQVPIAKRHTNDSEAYALYLQGRYLWQKRGNEDLKKAIEYFNRAIEKDPAYALAYSGAADSYIVLGENRLMPAKEAFAKAIAAAREALKLDPDLAEAHASLAVLLYILDHDFMESEKEFKEAIELNPGYALAHHWFAFLLSTLGRHDQAIEEILTARALDPISPRTNANVGIIYYFARRYDRAVIELNKSIELFPEHAVNYGHLGVIYSMMERYEAAIRSLDRASKLDSVSGGGKKVFAAYCFARSGDRAEAKRRLEEIIKNAAKELTSSVEIAMIFVGLGDKESAFFRLNKAFSENDPDLVYLSVDPVFDPLRSDPRYTELLDKIGF